MPIWLNGCFPKQKPAFRALLRAIRKQVFIFFISDTVPSISRRSSHYFREYDSFSREPDLVPQNPLLSLRLLCIRIIPAAKSQGFRFISKKASILPHAI